MQALSKYFDHYVINARLKPAFFALMPIAITTLAWCPKAQEVGGVVLTFLITFGVMAFLSNLVSNLGNQLQTRLFDDWGGAPTTILLRHADKTLDIYSKQRYHKWLQSKLPDLKMPSPENEDKNSVDADHIYTSAVSFLREYARDKNKFPMVYSDNVAYGFSRNLLVLRPIGIGVTLTSIFLNVALVYFYFVNAEREFNAFVGTNISMILFASGSVISSLIVLWIFCKLINDNYVHGRAIRYAKSLLAVCETSK